MLEFNIFITSFRRKPVVALVRGATNSFNLVAAPDFQRLSSVLAVNNDACSFSSNGRLLLSVFKRINSLYAGRGKVLDVACHHRCAVAQRPMRIGYVRYALPILIDIWFTVEVNHLVSIEGIIVVTSVLIVLIPDLGAVIPETV